MAVMKGGGYEKKKSSVYVIYHTSTCVCSVYIYVLCVYGICVYISKFIYMCT